MNIKKLSVLLLVAYLASAGAGNAQTLSGSLTLDLLSSDSGYATASSMALFQTNIIESTTGDFTSLVPQNSILMADFQTLSGLSSSPLSDSINNYLMFSSKSYFPGGGLGTTPSNRFDFDLATITEVSYDSADGVAVFTGTGTIVDTTGAYQNTPGEFTVTFSGPGDYSAYSLIVEAVPEPAALSLVAAGMLGIFALRRSRN